MKDIGYTSYEYLKEEMDSRGMTSEVIWGPSAEDIQDNLRNGKVMLVSVNSNTIFTGGSHIMAIVDINTDGQIYICNPSSRTNDGWFDVSEVMKGCDYIVVTDARSSGVASTTSRSSSSGYVAVVATWNQTNTKIETDDPNVEAYDTTQYSMTTTTVNYQAMVEPYTMPFDFLWALLVVGEEKEFVFELADLVYGSDIQVTIYDNLTENTNIDEWNYDQQQKTQVDIAIVGFYEQYSASRSESNHEHEEINNYSTKKTVVTKTNTINQVLTKADTWIVDYTNDYTYTAPSTTSNTNTVTQPDQEYPSEADSTGDSFECEHTEQYKQEVIAEISSAVEAANNTDSTYAASSGNNFDPTLIQIFDTYLVRYYSRYINISDTITNTTKTQKYTEGTPEVKEKTDASTDRNGNPKELNFVTIYRKSEHMEARKNINSVASWLFEIVEENGKPDLDLVKYLLYKATGRNYGVTEYDFSEYDASTFTTVVDIYGGDFDEKIWWALLDAGYSKFAAAGALGNFYCESGVVACRVQGDYSDSYRVSQQYTAQVDSGAISRDEFIYHGPRRRPDMDLDNGHGIQEKLVYMT